MSRIHGTCVAVDGGGVLLLGPSGCGKSDLALRLIDDGGVLVADDQITLSADGRRLYAEAPPTIAGLLEVYGLGIVKVDHIARVVVSLAVSLEASACAERLPRPATRRFLSVAIPLIAVDATRPSAAARVRLAVRTLAAGNSVSGALGDSRS